MTRTARTSGFVAALAAGAFGLAACGGGGTGYGSSGTTSGGASQSAAGGTGASAMSGALKTASTSLGTVVVDQTGRTVYYFEKDTANSGKSACTGGCASIWPAVTVSGTPTATGVTGKLGTITRADDGSIQVTYNGLPLYFFKNDKAPGDLNGVYENWVTVAP